MKKVKKAIRFFTGWIVSLIASIILLSIFIPANENGVIELTFIPTLLLLILPIVFGILFSRTKCDMPIRRFKAKNNAFSVPKSKKKQTELAASILADLEVKRSLVNEATCLSFFINWYDEMLEGFQKLMQLEKAPFKSPPALDYYRLKDEFQLHLCDAIARARDDAIGDIKGKYKNSTEFQRRAYDAFKMDIDDARSRFSADTEEFAEKAIADVQHACSQAISFADDPLHTRTRPSYDVSVADALEGHEFEHWCADLLRENEFTNVEVTPSSGDHGIDVLAEKDGVKYAVQCKRYSHDLDNTPVQEAAAGKQMYHCYIAAVMTNRYFTRGAKELAEANGVLLWDRDKLQQMIDFAKQGRP